MTLTKSVTPALALALMSMAVPREAEACDPDACFSAGVLDSLTPVNAASIPSDGVLLLRATGQGSSAWHETVTLDVTLDGQPVPGALEVVDALHEALLWRATDPLAPGVYKATGVVDNPDDLDYCGDDLDLDFEFTVDGDPSTPLIAPEVSAVEEVKTTPFNDITTLVCCEGVTPTQTFYDCGSGEAEIQYEEGGCAQSKATGVLTVTLDVAPKLPVATVGLLAYSLVVDGETLESSLSPQLERVGLTPLCAVVAVTNLATGEVAMTEEACHGEALVAQLGPQSVDPTSELTCEGALQTCELDMTESAWDLTKCTPWPSESETGTPTEGGSESDGSEASGSESGGSEASGTGDGTGETGEKGCACDEAAGGPWGALGLVGLLALRRRRRA